MPKYLRNQTIRDERKETQRVLFFQMRNNEEKRVSSVFVDNRRDSRRCRQPPYENVEDERYMPATSGCCSAWKTSCRHAQCNEMRA
jgi:hypothetical protein